MIGKNIDGYQIEEFLGKGGFGEVYKAKKDGKIYAIKFIRVDFIYPEERERVEREVSALKKVKSVYTVQYIGDGNYTENYTNYRYVVMEYVEGSTLREQLKDRTEPFEESEAVGLIKKILLGLHDIHKANIIHRDLKPENIKITPDGQVKLLDYGLSKIIDYSSITQTGAVVGTYFYMSPEQVKGEKPIAFGTDFYSIGVILYELLTNKILFYPSSDAQIVYKTVHVKPPYPSSINPKISNKTENITLKLLEKEVFKRYKDIDEIVADLEKKAEIPEGQKVERLKFYPRLIQNDTNIVHTYLEKMPLDGADFPINLHAGYKSITAALRQRANEIDFFADPGTNRMPFSNFRKTKGLRELPYAPEGYDPYEPENFDDVDKIKTFVSQVIDLQVANGCSVLTAPFFYFDNTQDGWYQVDLKMLRESIDYVRNKYPQYPVSGALCTQAEILCRKSERDSIIEDFGYCNMDFCQFYIDKIDENTVDAQLFNFIQAALGIKNFNKAKLVACRVPAVALGFLTVGFDAITSGLAVLESFNKGVILKEEEDLRMPTRFYFPDLLLSVPFNSGSKTVDDIFGQEEELKKKFPDEEFTLKCNCEGCKNGNNLSQNFQVPRLHFLHNRKKEIDALNEIPAEKRKDFFFSRIDKAYKLQTELISLGVKLKSPGYLTNWKEILGKY